MIKGGFQPSLSTIGFHLHNLFGLRNDDARVLEDELGVRQIKSEAATMLLHLLKNHIIDG